MNKNKKKITLIILLTFITVSLLSFPLSAVAQGEIKDMNFKGADIRDVLRAIAEVAQVNLVTDSSVSGNITIHLREISFDEALNLITQTTGLAYKWDGNTVVVATPQRIEEVYAERDLKIVEFENKDLQRVKSVVESVYPDLNVVITKENVELILVGKREDINGATDLINRVSFPDIVTEKEQKEQEKEAEEEKQEQEQDPDVLEIVKIKHGNLSEIVNNVKALFPELVVQTDTNNEQIIFKGKNETINKAKELISKIDLPTFQEVEVTDTKEETTEGQTEGTDQESTVQEVKEVTEFVKIENIPSEELISKIKNIYPDLKMSYDEINQQLIIRGTEEKIDNALILVDRFDQEMKKTTEIVNVDYVNIENVTGIVSSNIPEVNLNTNQLAKEIVVSGKVNDVKRAVRLIKNIDVPRRQVIIEARVEEISRSSSESLGIVDPTSNLPRIEFLKNPQGQISGLTAKWPQILTALESEGEAETLANPRLMTLNGEEGKMLIGDRIPVKGVNAEGEVNISYIEAGITLEFLPWITQDNLIELEVSPKVSSLGEELYEGYPSIRTREVSTKLRLRDGQTFAIGGLIQEDMKSSENKVPILSEIPILGHLFKYNNEDEEKSELVIFITPHIVEEEQVSEVKNDVPSLEETDEDQENKNTEKSSSETKEATEQKSSSQESTKQEETKKNEEDESKNEALFNELSAEELDEILNSSSRKQDKNIPKSLNLLYTVKADESIDDIAAKYGISSEEIKSVNNIEDEINKGTELTLKIPGSHLIRIGKDESIQSIINKQEVSLEQILKLNNLKSVEQIKSDMLLVLPHAVK